MAEHLASQDVDYLDGSRAVDDDFSVADKGEVIAHVGIVFNKDEFEPRSVVGVAGVEGVTRRLQQVDIVACEVID